MAMLEDAVASEAQCANHDFSSKGTDSRGTRSRSRGRARSAGRLEISHPQSAAESVEIKVGTVQWIEPGTTHRLKNVGDARIEIVDIQLKPGQHE